MRRALLASLLVLTAAPAALAAVPAQPPRNALEEFICERPTTTLDRAISVTGVMRPVPGTQRMEMRFVLQRRDPGADSFTPVQGGDLGQWLSPKPLTLGQLPSDVWRLKKLVANLAGPATYRFRVSFRWRGASGVLNRATLISDACTEPR